MSIETVTDGAIATITLNRPEKLNAFAGTMREDLLEALRNCEGDGAIRAVILTGAGRAFCAGGDVGYMSELQKEGDSDRFRELLRAGGEIILQIVSMGKPVIAAVNGIAAGAGCNLALACDYRFASDAAKFAQSFVRIGLHPDWGGTWLLPRLVGRSRAFELMSTARVVAAQEALGIGLADRVVPADSLMREAIAFASELAGNAPLAIAAIKKGIAASETSPLDEHLELETRQQLECFASEDAREGIAAFFEKRSPEFRGR